MFTDQAGILIAAAILAQHGEAPPMLPGDRRASSMLMSINPVERLETVLREMATRGLIPAELLSKGHPSG